MTGFAAIPNWLIRDASFGLYEIAVFTALASHTGPGGIYPSQETLAKEARCSVRKVREALAKLEALGLVDRVRRSSSTGRANDGYVIHPNGRLAEGAWGIDSVPAPRAGRGSQPAPGAAGTGTAGQVAPLIEEEPNKNRASHDEIATLFEAAWSKWPKKTDKKKSREKFTRLAAGVSAEWLAREVTRFGVAYAASVEDARFVPALVVWLNGERWTDPLPEPLRAEEQSENAYEWDWANQ